MKQVLVIDMQFIFDADENDAVWSGSREFEKSQKKVVADLGGEEEVLSKQIISDNYAKYVVLVKRKEQQPKPEEPTLEGPKIAPPKEESKKIPKGSGAPFPKGKDKKIKFSYSKGPRLPEKKKFKATLGGRS